MRGNGGTRVSRGCAILRLSILARVPSCRAWTARGGHRSERFSPLSRDWFQPSGSLVGPFSERLVAIPSSIWRSVQGCPCGVAQEPRSVSTLWCCGGGRLSDVLEPISGARSTVDRPGLFDRREGVGPEMYRPRSDRSVGFDEESFAVVLNGAFDRRPRRIL